MTTTYNLIAKQTVGANGATSVTFSNIPQTFTDLKIVTSVRKIESGGAINLQMRFNGSTSNYSQRLFYGTGSATGTAFDTSELGFMYVDDASKTANTFASIEIYIPNYASTSTYKSVSIDNVTENNATSTTSALVSASWSNNSAITNIYFQVGNGASTFTEFTTFYLYGISKSSTQNTSIPLASGGDVITTDGTYWYHTFLYSGTFTPLKNLTCDYLVVAGGGASGYRTADDYYYCGGGGAGGLRSTVTATGGGGTLETPAPLVSSTPYTITVGAGGATIANGNGNNGSNSSIAGTGLTTITSVGGGGGIYPSYANGSAGGSGGGPAGDSSTQYYGGAGTTNQGYAGGNMEAGNALGGGAGGGAGGVGGSSTGNTGKGGTGGAALAVAITGSSVYYAGGGAGGRGYYGSNPSLGDNGTGYAANTPNRGMGGRPDNGANAKGSSGIVVFRYPVL